MAALTALLLRFRKQVMIVFGVVTLFFALLIPAVSVNYDMAEYLPESSASRRALSVMEGQFPYAGNAELMAENISVQQALELKAALLDIEGVDSVLWLDDVADLTLPLSQIDNDYLDAYYRDENALFFINFCEDNYSLLSGDALVAVREAAAAYHPAIYGTAEESRFTRSAIMDELFNIMVVIIPICLLILLLISNSWFEPLLYIFVICIAVVLNMGSNIIFDSVSFIIFSMGAAMQLAVSMDYSLFLTHRFEEELNNGLPLEQAIVKATVSSFPSIFASALTTVAGFSALGFMEYGIGRDIGFVLAKGVALSFLCVIFFLPPLLRSTYRLIEKTRHRTLLHISASAGRRITRPRYLSLALMIIVIVPAYFGQLNTDFLYGDSSGSATSGQYAEETARIRQTFPVNDQVLILVPNGNIAAEWQLSEELSACDYVESIQALTTLADPTLPRWLLPQQLLDNFIGADYTRLIVYINTVVENPAMFAAADDLRQRTAALYGDDYYIVGKAISIADIRHSVQVDIRPTMLFSMAAVALIILVTFRSLLLPVLLVAAIQAAIYINMAVPYFLGQPLVLIGYLVVSSLQLGATIDYAILLASRYNEARQLLAPPQAAAEAVHRSGISVITSGLILTTAGFAEAYLSQIAAVKDIGMLIGRGALLSMGMVLLALPALLTLFDRPIRLLTYKSGYVKRPRQRSKK